MIIQRLQWAGIMIQSGNTKLLIDPVYESPNNAFFGHPKELFKPLNDIFDVDAVLITHLHSDHFDPEHIIQHFGAAIPVFVPEGCIASAEERGLTNVKGMKVGDNVNVKNVIITGIFAVDGLGDEQLTWIIKAADGTVLHGGDTLWHGYWWKIAEQHGPFDAVFLPVNGAVVSERGMTDSHQAICMNPEQAAAAARILEAKTFIPVHYGAFHNPPHYKETDRIMERLEEAALTHGIQLKILKHHESLIIQPKVNESAG